MNYLCINSSDRHGVYYGPSEVLGEIIAAVKLGYIAEQDFTPFHEWAAQLPKDDQGRPIKPDLGVETHQINGEVEKQIDTYIKENGQESISEIIFDAANMTFSIDEEVKAARLNAADVEAKKAELAKTDLSLARGVEDLIEILKAKAVIADGDIPKALAEKISTRKQLRSEISV